MGGGLWLQEDRWCSRFTGQWQEARKSAGIDCVDMLSISVAGLDRAVDTATEKLQR